MFILLLLCSDINFEIEQSLMDYYYKVENIVNTEFDIYEKCLPDNIKSELNAMTELQQADRGIRYGYKKHNNNHKSLVEKIAYRLEQDICINPDEYKFQEVAEAINQLDRFPLLVLIDEDMSYPQLKQIHNGFKNIPNKFQSVLFRIDNKDEKNAAVNDYIKDNELNNWVDSSTKIVYIKKNKLPKVLLQTDFTPICALGKTSNRCNSNVSSYINLFCDCVIYHDKSLSLFRRTASAYL